MPTNLDRVQVLLQPDTYARVRTLSKADRRSASAMCAELIEVALRLPKYRDLYELACETVGEVPPKHDPRLTRKQEGLRAIGDEAVKGGFSESDRAKAMKHLDIKVATDEEAELMSKEKEMIQGTGLDKLTPERLRELQQVLKLMEVMNG